MHDSYYLHPKQQIRAAALQAAATLVAGLAAGGFELAEPDTEWVHMLDQYERYITDGTDPVGTRLRVKKVLGPGLAL